MMTNNNDASWTGVEENILMRFMRPGSTPADLEAAEKKILGGLSHLMDERFVPIRNGECRLRTVVFNKESPRMPLVLVHGFGSGVGLWVLNYLELAQHRPVYAFDVLGFGRSSRPEFSQDANEAERELAESIEDWRKEMGLEKFIIAGHSFGGFISAAYSILFPDHVRHLVLIDPWGFAEIPRRDDESATVPSPIMRMLVAIISPFNPLGVLRACGSLGPRVVARLRPDLIRKFSDLFDDDNIVPSYVFHCNAQHPSGEAAFKSISENYGWAKHPMLGRINDIDHKIPISFLYGSRSWIDSTSGFQIQSKRGRGCYVNVQQIKGAGHHVYADHAEMFNELMNDIGRIVDLQMDILGPLPEDAQEVRTRLRLRGRTFSEMTLDQMNHESEQAAASLGNSYSMGLIQDCEEEEKKKMLHEVAEEVEKEEEEEKELKNFTFELGGHYFEKSEK